jgi:hypothetical protein
MKMSFTTFMAIIGMMASGAFGVAHSSIHTKLSEPNLLAAGYANRSGTAKHLCASYGL